VFFNAPYLEQWLSRGRCVSGHLRHYVNCALRKRMPPRECGGIQSLI
jgi:hypothetical protein